MKLVLDASFAVAWVGGQQSIALAEFTERFIAGTLDLHAPELFVAQTTQALWDGVRRGVRTLDEGVEMFANLRDARIELHGHRDLATAALDLALRRGIAPTDAFYVALAIREALPLFTADHKLGAAAEDLVDVVTA